MSFLLRYRAEFTDRPDAAPPGALAALTGALTGAGLPLRLSNDVLDGTYVLDADITVTMSDGAAADAYEAVFTDLPRPVAELLREQAAAGTLVARLGLGYADEPTTLDGGRPVVVGPVTAVETVQETDGTTRTLVRGQETAGYALRTEPVARAREGDVPRLTVVRELLAGTGVALAPGSAIAGVVANPAVRAPSRLAALHRIAEEADTALVVRDGAVHLGPAVGAREAPVVFDPERNIARLGDGRAEEDPGAAGTGPGPVRTGIDLVVLGHPGLRVGQTARLTGLDGLPGGPLRLTRVEHRFGVSGGYTCAVRLSAVARGRRVRAVTGVEAVVDGFRDVVDRRHLERPSVAVGEARSGAAGHRASLYYGQPPGPGQPSSSAPVDTSVTLYGQSLASPFAFHRCGLVVPVYPGMRALLAHNGGRVDDAVVAGWLWADPADPAGSTGPAGPAATGTTGAPGSAGPPSAADGNGGPSPRPGSAAGRTRHLPPPAEPGDHWLALPTAIGADGLPTGAGVHDLTDAAGHRVVHAAGLRILVGGDALDPVGTRPEPPPPDTVTIEHHSGTRIEIGADGALTITTASSALTLTNGAVSVRLDGPTVEVA
ncbi:hypothetical protein JNUCC64_30645 [Streptomyces sp. JNUCC 64]